MNFKGNFASYYSFRPETRLDLLLPIVRNRHVLDIGCNAGHLTVTLAKEADTILGIDIDRSLIKKAWNHLSMEFSLMAPYSMERKFPRSFPLTIGSVPIHGKLSNCKFRCMDVLADNL